MTIRHALTFLYAFALLAAPVAASGSQPLEDYFEPLPPASAQESEPVPANCSVAGETRFWLCQALTTDNCSLVRDSEYWFCKALTERNCTLVTASDYWFCMGVTRADCSVVEGDRFWLCKGVTEQNCSVVRPADYWFCMGLGGRFRRES